MHGTECDNVTFKVWEPLCQNASFTSRMRGYVSSQQFVHFYMHFLYFPRFGSRARETGDVGEFSQFDGGRQSIGECYQTLR